RIEVLNVSGADSDHVSAFQKREKIPRATNESRNHIPKQRRATGDSVNRPRAGSRAATGSSFSNATSAPRPIPKSGGKKTAEPSTESSAYSFDDTIDNPFKPSTPSSFTPSMEPTGFFKPVVASLESTSLPTESFMKSTARKPAATSTPDQGDSEPIKASVGRSRNASVSAMRPNHDDMILPAVARRIKEQGLHEHDVIAYSDAYDAPLYKLPSTPAYENNPFASYDRAKAVSSSSLAQQRSPEDSSESISKDRDKKKSKSAGTEKGDEMVQGVARKENRRRSHTGPPAPEASARPSIEVPSSAESPSERASRGQRGGVSRSNSRRQRRQQQEQYEQNEQRRLQEQYEQHEQIRQQEQYEQHDEQLRQQQPYNAHDATSAQELRPERPRRARRNTDRQLQADSPIYNEEPMPRRERRPTMPGKQENARTNGSDNLYPQNSHYQGHQSPQGAQKEWNDPHDPYSRQQRQVAPPESWDRRRQANDDAAQPPYAYKQNGNTKNGHEMAPYRAQGEMSRHSQQHYAGDQMQAYPPHQDAHKGYHRQQDYVQEQGSYRHQPQDDYKFQGNGSSQHPNASRASYPQPEMVQVEMSQLDPGIKDDEQHGSGGKINPSQENIKKKKETLCCIIC
ncbi:hypothetical protein BGZ70_008567, partial [Mortierella alpina]